ncbi:hypothetical protein DMC47_42205 [Nostoc sp. 3335mG]|nr:hypothetical protein DMC47_42205 [Nostoc sp. 3335mG]
MPRRRAVRFEQPEPRPLVPAEALARLGELSEKEMWGTQLPHPAHGPIEALPRDAQGFIPAYYFRSPQEIDEEGLEPPAGLRPGPGVPLRGPAPGAPADGLATQGALTGAGPSAGASGASSDAPALPDAPLPALRRARLDGFDPAKQRAFLAVLAETGSVAQACAAVGIARSTAYKLRMMAEAQSFRVGWEQAMAQGVRLLADTALARALDGVEEPVFFKGEEVGTRRRYNDRLLMFLLKNRWLYAPTMAPDPRHVHDRVPVHGIAGLSAALDRIAPPEPDAQAGPRLRTLL